LSIYMFMVAFDYFLSNTILLSDWCWNCSLLTMAASILFVVTDECKDSYLFLRKFPFFIGTLSVFFFKSTEGYLFESPVMLATFVQPLSVFRYLSYTYLVLLLAMNEPDTIQVSQTVYASSLSPSLWPLILLSPYLYYLFFLCPFLAISIFSLWFEHTNRWKNHY
jgi:hypothetical protein